MKKLSKNSLLNTAFVLLSLLIVAKALTLTLMWFLPSDGVDFKEVKNYRPAYIRVDFNDMIQTPSHTVVQKKEQVTPNGISITNMILKGLYGRGESGFAIVALKSAPTKTTLVSVGDEFSGYVLKEIHKDSVIFIKNNKEYVLNMKVVEVSKKSSVHFVKKTNKQATQPTQKNVSKNDIQSYAKNPDQIWKDISIIQLKNNQGFKVTRIRKDSKMDALGLQVGDIMIRANNSDLKSYKDAINLYKNINTLDVLELVVLRNNQEKEIIYEIN